jgi:hypothetical protein
MSRPAFTRGRAAAGLLIPSHPLGGRMLRTISCTKATPAIRCEPSSAPETGAPLRCRMRSVYAAAACSMASMPAPDARSEPSMPAAAACSKVSMPAAAARSEAIRVVIEVHSLGFPRARDRLVHEGGACDPVVHLHRCSSTSARGTTKARGGPRELGHTDLGAGTGTGSRHPWRRQPTRSNHVSARGKGELDATRVGACGKGAAAAAPLSPRPCRQPSNHAPDEHGSGPPSRDPCSAALCRT